MGEIFSDGFPARHFDVIRNAGDVKFPVLSEGNWAQLSIMAVRVTSRNVRHAIHMGL